MNRRFLTSFAPLLTIAAFAMMPVAAQAVPHYFRNGALIPEGRKGAADHLVGHTHAHLRRSKITCKKADAENVENPVGGGAGRDETVIFYLYECTAAECPAETRLERLRTGGTTN